LLFKLRIITSMFINFKPSKTKFFWIITRNWRLYFLPCYFLISIFINVSDLNSSIFDTSNIVAICISTIPVFEFKTFCIFVKTVCLFTHIFWVLCFSIHIRIAFVFRIVFSSNIDFYCYGFNIIWQLFVSKYHIHWSWGISSWNSWWVCKIIGCSGHWYNFRQNLVFTLYNWWLIKTWLFHIFFGCDFQIWIDLFRAKSATSATSASIKREPHNFHTSTIKTINNVTWKMTPWSSD